MEEPLSESSEDEREALANQLSGKRHNLEPASSSSPTGREDNDGHNPAEPKTPSEEPIVPASSKLKKSEDDGVTSTPSAEVPAESNEKSDKFDKFDKFDKYERLPRDDPRAVSEPDPSINRSAYDTVVGGSSGPYGAIPYPSGGPYAGAMPYGGAIPYGGGPGPSYGQMPYGGFNPPYGQEKPTNGHSEEQKADQTELFVGNLPYAATQEQVESFFARYGDVISVKLIQRVLWTLTPHRTADQQAKAL